MKGTVLLLLVLIITVSCVDGFEQPFVISVTPLDNSLFEGNDLEIKVLFSLPMDTVKTNNEFSLSSSDMGNIGGRFFWENGDRTLCFRPTSILTGTGAYTIRVTTEAEDRKGNDLKNEFVSFFYVDDDSSRPRVLSFSPYRDSIGNPLDTSVVIEFTEPVDMNTVYTGASISPSVEGYWSSMGNSVIFVPLYGFSYGVTYSVYLHETLCDISGNSLAETMDFSFTVGSDFKNPFIDAVYQENSPNSPFDEDNITEGREKDNSLVIDFSEQVKTSDLVKGISISPSCDFYITSSVIPSGAGEFTRAFINFIKNMESNEIYTLKISSVIRDLEENNLDREYRYVFITNGLTSIAPWVKEMGNNTAGIYTSWVANGVQPLSVSGDIYESVIVEFSTSMNPVTLLVYVERVAGTGGAVSVIAINWFESDGVPLSKLVFSLDGADSGNIYKIVIRGGSGGIRDSNGNIMKEDYVQIVRF